ncbi:IS200/IS605 family transposase [Desulfobacterium sp. N47]|uniref:IS200/IS605 family transposase n=1 Tax=Desulfobacterium sp. N47 TaxID=3115210 RepID=UPI003F4A46D9
MEGYLMSDHIHMCLSVPPKYGIAFAFRFLKGKSAGLIHRTVLKKKRISGLHFWGRGYCVSIVRLDEETIRNYIREQENIEKEQLYLDLDFDE